ncbi:hypothetical protein JRG19_08270 [Pseudoclavibacter alba]|uniref:hypothetical protein n=1 Tax=Pseudoclavibacter albus TaxID=272241 RepID=UPI0019D1557E|nr:hypothetical protein [Pseudoclavibacter alba]MBN6778534.1 hypothetical protein [Pseudoclavibacter alba]
MTMSLRGTTAVVSLALAALALTGCQAEASSPSPSEVAAPSEAAPSTPASTAVTCADITAKTDEIQTEIETAVTKITNGDVAGGTAELQGVADDAKQLAEGIDDPQLKTRVDAVTAKLDEITTMLQDGMSWTEAAELATKSSELQTAAGELSKYCEQHG